MYSIMAYSFPTLVTGNIIYHFTARRCCNLSTSTVILYASQFLHRTIDLSLYFPQSKYVYKISTESLFFGVLNKVVYSGAQPRFQSWGSNSLV